MGGLVNGSSFGRPRRAQRQSSPGWLRNRSDLSTSAFAVLLGGRRFHALIFDTAASLTQCKIGISAPSPRRRGMAGATTSALGDHLREPLTGPQRSVALRLHLVCLRIFPTSRFFPRHLLPSLRASSLFLNKFRAGNGRSATVCAPASVRSQSSVRSSRLPSCVLRKPCLFAIGGG